MTHAAITEDKRLSDVLACLDVRQDERPILKVTTHSEKIGYTPRGRKPGKRTDYMNHPAVIARRTTALSKLDVAD